MGEVENGEFGGEIAQVCVEVHDRAGRRLDEDEAEPLFGGDGGEVLAGAGFGVEIVFLGHAEVAAGVVIGPGVEAAGEAIGLAAGLAHNPRGAVRADIEEGAHLPVLCAGEQDRHAGIVERAERAGFGQVRGQAGDHRHLAEQALVLARVELGIAVEGNVLVQHFGRKRGRAAFRHIDDARREAAAQRSQRGIGIDVHRLSLVG